MLCAPAESVEIDRVATLPFSEDVPICFAPSTNATMPVGVPAPGMVGAMVAVNVTLWFRFAEAGAFNTVVVPLCTI